MVRWEAVEESNGRVGGGGGGQWVTLLIALAYAWNISPLSMRHRALSRLIAIANAYLIISLNQRAIALKASTRIAHRAQRA